MPNIVYNTTMLELDCLPNRKKRKSRLELASENLLEFLKKDCKRFTSNEFLCLTPEQIEEDEKFAKENTQGD